MRVLFSSIGAIGHVAPMVPLAQALAAAGNEVRWACGPDMCPMIELAGISTVAAGMTGSARQARLVQRIGEFATLAPTERTNRLATWTFGELLAPAMLDDLPPLARTWRPELMVHDSMEFAAPIAAAAVGAVHVAHSYGPLSPEHRILSITDLVSHLWEAVGLEARPYGGLYDHLYLDIYPPSIQPLGGDHVDRRQLLRPVSYPPPDRVQLPAGLTDDPDRPLIYVTFGTEMPDDRPLRLVIDAVGTAEMQLLVTIGAHRDPAEFGPQPASVVIERFVPQTAVLPHAAAVISHGGSGTVLGALGAGLPQLCLPYIADQPINARAVSDAGAGLVLEIATLDQESISQDVTRLLAEGAFAQRAGALADEIAGMPSPVELAATLAMLTADG